MHHGADPAQLGAQVQAELQALETEWPAQARLNYNDRGGINKNSQRREVKNFLKEMMLAFEDDFAFSCGIYRTKAERDRAQYLIALETSRELKYNDIKDRLRKDESFRALIIGVVRTTSLYRYSADQ